MYPKTIELENWLPFKGTQTVELGPTVYAVLAQVQGREGRSNWSGKTAFLEAFAFALYGIHRKRTEDEWIHEGQKQGGVKITFNTGVTVRRFRIRGGATRLEVSDGVRDLGGEEAQTAIHYLVGMTKPEFLNTCYFKQKDIARIVYARPAERAREFNSWFRLGSLKIAETRTLQALNQVMIRIGEIDQMLGDYDAGMRSVLGEERTNGQSVSSYLEIGVERLKVGREARDHKRQAEKRAYDQIVAKVASAKDYAVEYRLHQRNVESLRDRMRFLKGQEPQDSTQATDKRHRCELVTQSARATWDALQGALEAAQALMRGDFDGVCPVNAMACPVKDQIVSAENLNRAKLNRVKAEVAIAKSELEFARKEQQEAQIEEMKVKSIITRFNHAQEEVQHLRPSVMWLNTHEAPREFDDLRHEKEAAYVSFTDSVQEYKNFALAVDEWASRIDHARQLETELVTFHHDKRLYQIASFVLGKQGAQRVIAERVLGAIVDNGNRKLARCEIDLSFDIVWAREGDGLADQCSACGAPFPASRRIRSCGRCKEPRGAKLIEKSDIEFSARSGAAEDIIGGAIRLEAGSWFRMDRGSQWGVLFIDEPFGALDEVNREAFSRLILDSCSAEQGNEQAFVVAHHPDVTSILPASIIVTRHANHSTIQVTGTNNAG
jgi:DNA repair exonuclease SbcCD ATPase subunit